jgi:hypothetical protein
MYLELLQRVGVADCRATAGAGGECANTKSCPAAVLSSYSWNRHTAV